MTDPKESRVVKIHKLIDDNWPLVVVGILAAIFVPMLFFGPRPSPRDPDEPECIRRAFGLGNHECLEWSCPPARLSPEARRQLAHEICLSLLDAGALREGLTCKER